MSTYSNVCEEISADRWFHLATWLKTLGLLEGKQRSQCVTIGRFIQEGRSLSPRLAWAGATILAEVSKLGASPWEDEDNIQVKQEVAKPPKEPLRRLLDATPDLKIVDDVTKTEDTQWTTVAELSRSTVVTATTGFDAGHDIHVIIAGPVVGKTNGAKIFRLSIEEAELLVEYVSERIKTSKRRSGS